MLHETPGTTPDSELGFHRRFCCTGRGLFVPLLLIALGVIFLLDQFQVFPADRVFAYFWPVIFICYGVDALAWRPGNRRAVWGVGAIAVGVALILQNLGYWAFDLARLWPLLLIAFGLSLLLRGPRRGGRRRYRGVSFASDPANAAQATWGAAALDSDESDLDGIAVLGGIQRRITSQQFRGGRLTAFFGGFNVDLTGADIAGDTAVLEISALFGGGEVRVPNTWIVDMQGHALLGGYSDETHQVAPGARPKRLIVQGTAVFGGVVIKN
jgi:hypothetical protein